MDLTFYDQQLSVLVVDDALLYRSFAENILTKAGYTVYLAESGEQVLELLKNIHPNVILLDIVMQGLDGYETFQHILNAPKLCHIPVIFLTAETDSKNELKGFQMGSADYISKPFVPEIMLKRMQRVIQLDLFQQDLERQVQLKSEQLEKISLQAISTIAATIDAKDRYTKGHSDRVAQISLGISKILGFTKAQQIEIHNIALLHDIGKIGIPDMILNKPTKLTQEEYDIIKSHTEIGSEILKDITVIPNICDGARWHHERYDGKGYPDGLSGESIPLYARIIGIADAYDAMSSKRPYRNGRSNEVILGELARGRGTQFDPELVDVMIRLIEDGLEITEETKQVVMKGNLASESSELLYHVYHTSIEENRFSIGLDSLTQTYNKKFFELEVNDALKEDDTYGFFLIVNASHFKIINETYGHVLGDKLLVLLADLLRLSLGELDMVGRVDGDEFAVFLHHYTSEHEVKRLIKEILSKYSKQKETLDYHNISSLSIGISQFCSLDEDLNFDSLYRRAQVALYSIKEKPKKTYCFYQDILNKTKATATQKMEKDYQRLERYIERRKKGEPATDKLSEFEIAYQIVHQNSTHSDSSLYVIFLTLADNRAIENKADFDECMEFLKNAIKITLRHGDFDMQFNNREYLLFLSNVTESVCQRVADRVASYYQKLSKNEHLELIYNAHQIL